MAHNKGRILFKTIGSILRSLWKLFLMALYATAKVVQMLAEAVSTITEKFIK